MKVKIEISSNAADRNESKNKRFLQILQIEMKVKIEISPNAADRNESKNRDFFTSFPFWNLIH